MYSCTLAGEFGCLAHLSAMDSSSHIWSASHNVFPHGNRIAKLFGGACSPNMDSLPSDDAYVSCRTRSNSTSSPSPNADDVWSNLGELELCHIIGDPVSDVSYPINRLFALGYSLCS